MTTIFKFNLDLLAASKASLRKNFPEGIQGVNELTLENKRFAILERSVYTEGIKVSQKQERLGYVLTLVGSLVLLLLLYIVIRAV